MTFLELILKISVERDGILLAVKNLDQIGENIHFLWRAKMDNISVRLYISIMYISQM